MTDKKIIFYDSDCGLCDFFVEFVFRKDTHQIFHYSPLQGKTAQELLAKELTVKLDTVVFWRKGKLYTESKAALFILQDLRGIWSLISRVLQLIPRRISDWGYQKIAQNRKKIQKSGCSVHFTKANSQFLD